MIELELEPLPIYQDNFATELDSTLEYVGLGILTMEGKIPAVYLNVTIIHVLQRSDDPRVRALFKGKGPLANRLKAAAAKYGHLLNPNVCFDEEKGENGFQKFLRNIFNRPNETLKELAQLRERRASGQEVKNSELVNALATAAGPELFREMLARSRTAYVGVDGVVLLEDVKKDFIMVPTTILEGEILLAAEADREQKAAAFASPVPSPTSGSPSSLNRALEKLTGSLHGLVVRATRCEARLDQVYNQGTQVYDQGTNLINSFQSEATKNATRHADTTSQLNNLQATTHDVQRSLLKAHQDDIHRRTAARVEAAAAAEVAEAAELAAVNISIEANDAAKTRHAAENEHRQHVEKVLDQTREAAEAAASSAATAAKASSAMLGGARAPVRGVALEQHTPVRAKGPARGQGTPGASARGQGTPPSMRAGQGTPTPTPFSARVASAAQGVKGVLAKLSPSASNSPIAHGAAKPKQRTPAAAHGQCTPVIVRRTPAARGQSSPAAKPRTPVATRGQRTPARGQAPPTPGLRPPLSARVKSGVASAASGAASVVAKLSPSKERARKAQPTESQGKLKGAQPKKTAGI